MVIHDTGAHGHAMGFNYNGKLRPKELLLKLDGTVELIRREERLEDYFATLSFTPDALPAKIGRQPNGWPTDGNCNTRSLLHRFFHILSKIAGPDVTPFRQTVDGLFRFAFSMISKCKLDSELTVQRKHR